MLKGFMVVFVTILFMAGSPVFSYSANVNEEQAVNIVATACEDIQKDATGTLAKITNGEEPYTFAGDESLYVFVYDLDINIVAHPNKSLVGRNYKGKPDVRGKNFRDAIVKGAIKNGSGWEEYYYQKPGETGIHRKKTYYRLVKGSNGKQYVAACGVYQN